MAAPVSTKSFRGCPTVLRPVERKRGSTWSRLPDFTPGYTLFSSPRYFFPPSSSCLSSGPARYSIRSTIVREKAQLSRNISVFGRRVSGAKKKMKTKNTKRRERGEEKKREHERLCSEMISPVFLVDESSKLVNSEIIIICNNLIRSLRSNNFNFERNNLDLIFSIISNITISYF